MLSQKPTGQFGPGAMWSIREDFVAIFVGQAPMVVPIFKKRFWQQTRIRWTPKSSQGSEGNELSSGMSNQKKPDPYSLTQMGFTHITNITNITRGTRTEVTVARKDSQERLAVGAEQVAGEGSTSHGDRSDVEAGNSRSSNMDMASRSLEIARGPDPATWRRDTITSIIEISNVYRDL